MKYAGGKRTVVDGPFAEAKELIAGYTLIQVKSRAEAIEWAKRFPNPSGEGKDGEIELRQLYELEDFEPERGARALPRAGSEQEIASPRKIEQPVDSRLCRFVVEGEPGCP